MSLKGAQIVSGVNVTGEKALEDPTLKNYCFFYVFYIFVFLVCGSDFTEPLSQWRQSSSQLRI